MSETLRVYVPSAGSYLERMVLEGSGIVGTPVEAVGRVRIDYEGGKYGQPYFKRYANRVFHAAGRHTTNYPTVARAVVPADEVLQVGWFDSDRRLVLVDNSAALAGWIGEYDNDELQVEL